MRTRPARARTPEIKPAPLPKMKAAAPQQLRYVPATASTPSCYGPLTPEAGDTGGQEEQTPRRDSAPGAALAGGFLHCLASADGHTNGITAGELHGILG